MKIVGYTFYTQTQVDMFLKPDSALLVNNKPFFLPDFAKRFEMHPCLVGRISRMGRNIEERFADRYYDATAIGLNIQAEGDMEASRFEQHICNVAFDNSFVVGTFAEQEKSKFLLRVDESREDSLELTYMTLEHAIAQISKYITLRTGDMIAVPYVNAEPKARKISAFVQLDTGRYLERGMLIEVEDAAGRERLRCRIK